YTMNEKNVAVVSVTKAPAAAPSAPATSAAPPPSTPSYSGDDFEREIKRFSESIDSLLLSLPNVMRFMEVVAGKQRAEFFAFLKASASEKVVEASQIHFTVTGSVAPKALAMQRRLKNNHTAYRLIHRSFLISLISQYDAYLGRLLRLVYLVRPEKLNSSEKQITFKELVQFSSLDEARERLIEREVDSVVRRSHEDQIAWLKDNLSLNASAFIPELPEFIEVAQRRHLFVHCDGVVSAPYMKNCAAAGAKVPPTVAVGQQLEVSKDYLERAFELVYAVGAKVGFALWLSLLKADVNAAAACVNVLAFELVSNNRHSLAINLLEYALSGKQKPSNEQSLRFMILNLAQAYRWSEKMDRCAKLLDDYDWSASSTLIQLGVATLRDQYDEAYRLMQKLGHDDDFKKENYRDWPIFRELRKQAGFLTCYKEVYREDFEVATVVSTGPEHPSPTPGKDGHSNGPDDPLKELLEASKPAQVPMNQ
ncbi:MAG: hypothetical protein WCL11_25205, partial [Verrucomicrobiota bacterium]